MHPLFYSFTKEQRIHLDKSKASDKTDTFKVVYRLVKANEKKIDEARGEEASQSSQQQQCILNGGVYFYQKVVFLVSSTSSIHQPPVFTLRYGPHNQGESITLFPVYKPKREAH